MGKWLPLGEDGSVVLIDGQLSGDPQRATKRPIFGTSPSHHQHRSRIVPPSEQLTGAIEKRLTGQAEWRVLALDPCGKAVALLGLYDDPNAGRSIGRFDG
jgi:hypothetical protein